MISYTVKDERTGPREFVSSTVCFDLLYRRKAREVFEGKGHIHDGFARGIRRKRFTFRRQSTVVVEKPCRYGYVYDFGEVLCGHGEGTVCVMKTGV